MNILEEIQNCPVEWKELGEVCELKNGYTPSKTNKEFWENGTIPWFRLEDIRKNGRVLSNSLQHVSRNAIKGGKVFTANSLIVSTTATIGEVALITVPFLCNQQITAVMKKQKYEKDLDIKFLFYYLQILSSDMKKGINEGSFPIVSLSKMRSFKIPIPPLKIQEKIVQMLDKFTDYVTELTSELTSRKKQYSYYRDKLLSFEDEVYQVEWKTLGDIGKVSMCKRILKNQTSDDGEIPFYKIGTFGKVATSFISRELFEEYKLRFSYPKLGDILISASGTIGRTVVFNGEDSYFQDSNIVWLEHDESQVLNRYLYYFYQMNPWKVSDGGTISRLYNGNIEKTTIPVPSLEIQSRIVQVLDNFDMVCNDLNIGLPKEIELRQKQYEYFREKLLTFVAEGEYTDSTVQYRQDLIRLLTWVFGPIRVELGAVCDFVRGNGLQKKDFTAIGKSVIHYGQIYTKYDFSVSETLSKTSEIVFEKLKKAQPNDLVMATTSENVEDVGKAIVWEGKEEIGISGDSYIIQTTQNSRYLNYWLRSTSFQTQKERKVTGTKVIRINSKDIEKFQIILPSLIEQERIVSILDNFNTLTNSLSEGLPKEIELRQKQYEYWREQLLNFDL